MMAKIPECWVNLYVHPTTGRMWREVFDTKEEAVSRIKDYPASCALETAIPMCRVNALVGRDPETQEPPEEACPFCGKYDDLYCLQGELLNGERRVFEAAMGDGELVRIQCGYCGAMGPVVALPESDRMLADPPWDAWNRRTPPVASHESEADDHE